MILPSLILTFCVVPVLLIVLALLWMWLGQKIFAYLLGG